MVDTYIDIDNLDANNDPNIEQIIPIVPFQNANDWLVIVLNFVKNNGYIAIEPDSPNL